MIQTQFVKYFFVLMLVLSCATSLPFGTGELRRSRALKIDEEYEDGMLDNITSSKIVNNPEEDSYTIDDAPQTLNTTHDAPKPLEKADNVGSAILSSATNIFGSLFGIASRIIDVKTEAAVEGIGIAGRGYCALAGMHQLRNPRFGRREASHPLANSSESCCTHLKNSSMLPFGAHVHNPLDFLKFSQIVLFSSNHTSF